MNTNTPGVVPKHIGLFPDGNRRWAKMHGLSSIKGHERGREHFEEFLQWCKEKGVQVVTVYGFSTENWDRPEEEVSYLMDLFETYLGSKHSIENFQKMGVKVRIIGQKFRLRPSLQKVIENIEEITKENVSFVMNLAVSYGGRWDIVQAVQKIAEKEISAKDITEELIDNNLETAGLPPPDFIIRPGGEQRLSNLLIWQAAYAELYFSPKLWPDFSKEDFEAALAEYASRQRRFGH